MRKPRDSFERQDFFRSAVLRGIVVCTAILVTSACDFIADPIRRWGEEDRRRETTELDRDEIDRWKRDMNLSESEVIELNRTIEELVQERQHQGELSRRIARAYMDASLFDAAIPHYQNALQNEYQRDATLGQLEIEEALRGFEVALVYQQGDPELMFEAALCYANASRALAWERKRFGVAVVLFERYGRLKPDDARTDYQLALLYGKVEHEDLRNLPLAIGLLEGVVQANETDIPARFALAHMLVMNGSLGEAEEQYRQIMEILEDAGRGRSFAGIGGEDPQHRRARENLEKLQVCTSDLPGCEVLR